MVSPKDREDYVSTGHLMPHRRNLQRQGWVTSCRVVGLRDPMEPSKDQESKAVAKATSSAYNSDLRARYTSTIVAQMEVTSHFLKLDLRPTP